MRLHPRWLPLVASTLLLAAACNDRPNGPSPVPAPTSPPPLTITSLSPSEGLANDRIGVYGTGFAAGATITVDGQPASYVSGGAQFVSGFLPLHPPGPVDVVVTNPDGRSVTRTGGFTYGSVSLSVSQAVVRPGEPVSVSWTAPKRRPGADWIGLFAVGVPNETYIDGGLWKYTPSESGTLTFTAPGGAGEYEFRYFANDGYVDVARAAVAVR